MQLRGQKSRISLRWWSLCTRTTSLVSMSVVRFHVLARYFKWSKLGLPCGFCENSCMYSQWNTYSCNLSDANSLFSLEHCLARQSTWSSALCQALPCCSTNAKAMKSCVSVKILFAYLTGKISYHKNFWIIQKARLPKRKR